MFNIYLRSCTGKSNSINPTTDEDVDRSQGRHNQFIFLVFRSRVSIDSTLLETGWFVIHG